MAFKASFQRPALDLDLWYKVRLSQQKYKLFNCTPSRPGFESNVSGHMQIIRGICLFKYHNIFLLVLLNFFKSNLFLVGL